MSFFEDASLVLIPSAQKLSKIYSVKPTDGTGDLAFTRSNDTATRVASNGLIEKVRTNLVLSSNNISTQSTYWNANQSGVTTQNSAVAPDGTTTAALITPDGVSNYSGVNQLKTYTAVPNTYSVYLKTNSGTANVNVLAIDSASTFYGLTAITINTTWTRYTLTFTPAAGAGTIYITSSGSTAWLAWGAQLETGDIATDLIATTTAAVSVGPVANVPRLDYLNSSCPRLLLEPQRTNKQTFSEQINTTNYPISNEINVTENAGVSPDGYTNADKIIPTTTSAYHQVRSNLATSSGYDIVSVFVKASGYNYVQLASWADPTNYVNFDLTYGTVGTVSVATIYGIQSYGNGWYRIWANVQASGGGIVGIGVIPSKTAVWSEQFAGNGTDGVLMWGAQLEVGAYATSYIPTLGASVTRGADGCLKTGISSLIGQTEGTIYFEVDRTARVDNDYRVQISDGTTNNWLFLGVEVGNNIRAYVNVGGVNQFSAYGAVVTNGIHKVAMAYKANDFKVYIDGVAWITQTSGSVPACSRLNIGSSAPTTDAATDSKTSQTLLFKTRLSNADLAALTA